jgi:hypothetical protein
MDSIDAREMRMRQRSKRTPPRFAPRAETSGRFLAAAASVAAAILAAAPLAGQSPPPSHLSERPRIAAVRVEAPIKLDGRLDEAVWKTAHPATGFRQIQPDPGGRASERTEVRFAYDGEALYVGARMYDALGGSGVETRLVRRDADVESDQLSIIFDTFHDHLGRAEFDINPSDVRGDALGLGGSYPDPSWDPVWTAATTIDSLGWTAEVRIPFSQLRFPPDSVETWGLQIIRTVNRLKERTEWAYWPIDQVGGPSRYGHLLDVRPPDGHRTLEAVPYAVASSAHRPIADPTDPLARAHSMDYRFGADVDYQISPSLTLSATLNPDFGQVEVDPAVVNLSAFETFFPEKRPFFVQGSDLFDFGGFNCYFCSNVSSLDLFHSRRIGRSPAGASLAEDEGQFASVPENTSILGAVKLTGRRADGVSIGVLDALTARERATVVTAEGSRFQQAVAPPTNYFIGRAKRDFHDGNLVVGGIVTSVVRGMGDPGLESLLPRHAETAGLDAQYWWGGKTYRIRGQLAASGLWGDSSAILAEQESSARYFQRPDREGGGNGLFSDAFDPGATSLRGWAGHLRVAKESGGWLWETALNVRSPGFESNDLGFLTRADYWWMNANLFRHLTRPTSWYRELSVIAGGQQEYDFDGNLTYRDVHAFVGVSFLNYWQARAFAIRGPSVFDDGLTRGGPIVRKPGFTYYSASASTDSRAPLVAELSTNLTARDVGPPSYSASLSLRFKPGSNVSLSAGPAYRRQTSPVQYVTSVVDSTASSFYGSRYVFADLLQRELSMETRASITFTPELSLEVFLQPLVSSNRFSAFKEFTAPRSPRTVAYGRDIGTIDAAVGADGSREYTVDPDGPGPASAFSFGDPNFTLRSLRGNAVLRWQFRPGSTLFLVWTQARSGTVATGDLALGRDVGGIFRRPPADTFLAKVTWWTTF